MSPVIVTFEQDGKRATATLTMNEEKKTLEVSCKWTPGLDKKMPQEKDYFCVSFLKSLKSWKL